MYPDSADGDNGNSAFENLITSTGGCGLFQVLFVLGAYAPFFPIVWTGMFMVFGLYNPGWKCLDFDYGNEELEVLGNNDTGISSTNKSNESCKLFERCQRVEFNTDMSTIVSEWGLLCNSDWIPPFIISMQMVGVLIGGYAGGLVEDKSGRKFVLYGSSMMNGCISAITPFSVNWQMFTFLTFLLGVALGAAVSTVYLFPAEFLPIKWRGILTTAPLWSVCFLTFATLANFLRDWKSIFFVSGICSVLLCTTAFWIPESIRWLTVRGRLQKATDVANKIAKTNRKPLPDISPLNLIVQSERKTKTNHSILDIFRRGLLSRTLIIWFTWLTLSIVYYAIGFGVNALTGDFFLNLFLVVCIPIVFYPVVPLVTEKLGRRHGILLFFGFSSACCFSVVLTYSYAPLHVQHICLTLFAVLAYGSIESGWSVVLVFTYELYPTVVRGVGYGCANGTSRFGAIIAPFLIPQNYDGLYMSYIILGTILLTTSLVAVLLPETKGRPLEDTLGKKQVRNQDKEAQRDFLDSSF